MKCKTHKKYKAIRKPMKTNKFPKGCPDCAEIFNKKYATLVQG